MSSPISLGAGDPSRVAQFEERYEAFTWRLTQASRVRVLDERLRSSGLTLADKRVLLERLSPRPTDAGLDAITTPRVELRLQRLLLSIAPADLCRFKLALEYDGDYKDLEEYLYHDIDSAEIRQPILDHFASVSANQGIKLLTDVDDTLYANLLDGRYPKGEFYPGLLAFQAALVREPFELKETPITLLSARPNPLAGVLEEMSLRGLRKKSAGQLLPSALSGELSSSLFGTIESWARANMGSLAGYLPRGEEVEIGAVKWANFNRYASLYPEYGYVFCGDAGQADTLTAMLMLDPEVTPAAARVVTTFIHDISGEGGDRSLLSRSFLHLPRALRVDEHSATGRGVIVHRNYLQAAVIAYLHGETLGGLIDAADLARITRSALEELPADLPDTLREGYRQDASTALALLSEAGPTVEHQGEDVQKARELLAAMSPLVGG